MSEKSLKEKTFSGLGWSSLDKIFQQLIVLVSSIILLRILEQEDVGRIGVLSIFITLSNVLLEGGFTAAIIRKKNVTPADYITIFYSNISIASFLYLVLFFCAPVISHFYQDPLLTSLSRFLFLSFLFSSFGVVQSAKLYKDINYKLITKNNILSIFLSYSLAVILAFLGYGVWAWASQPVTYTFVRTCIYWIFTGWRPTGHFSKKSFRELFIFSSTLTAGNLLGIVITALPNVLGKVYSLGVTGIYYNASKHFNTVLEFLSGSVLHVPYPVLSAIDDTERLKRVFRKFIRVKAFIIFPVFMGMMLVANPFINVFLGDKWVDSIPILQLLCFGGIFYALDSSNGDLFKIKDKSSLYLIFTTIHVIAFFIVIGVILVFKLNYVWLVAALSVVYFLKYLAASIVANRLIDYRPTEFLKDLLPYFFITLAAIYCGYLLRYFIAGKLVLMLCQMLFVGVLYIGSLYLFGSAIVKEAMDLFKKK
ncbi:MAG: lipopolysaccharide biosynthesis protein [Dysgonamonadaceae bacterium]|jgi:O-antigen/teichoic acid export membrane protein|nr:lipopolysaccharide biosynthesis protein [Dysgonamonadaceae bacterium]